MTSRLPKWKNPKHLHFRTRPNAPLRVGGKKLKTGGKKVAVVRKMDFRKEQP
jgi:hypothetical protein